MSLREPAVVVVELAGRLTPTSLRAALVPATSLLSSGSRLLLLVDCRRMTGYESEARAQFVSWSAANREHLDRVAVVTENPLWNMVLAAMSLTARQELRPFTDATRARRWLDERMPLAS